MTQKPDNPQACETTNMGEHSGVTETRSNEQLTNGDVRIVPPSPMTSLADKVARVKELDAEYQREVAWFHKTRIKALDGYKFDTTKYIKLKPIKPAEQALYSHAPRMAALITQLWDEREQLVDALHNDVALETIQKQREVLGMAREQLNMTRTNHATRKLITAIDNLLISQHENNCKDAKHPQVMKGE